MNWIKRLFKLKRYFIVSIRTGDSVGLRSAIAYGGSFINLQEFFDKESVDLVVTNIIEVNRKDFEEFTLNYQSKPS